MSSVSDDTWATAGFEPKSVPNVFIQWKGTDVCLDFHCECGYNGHYDGGFAYGLRCGRCDKTWKVPHTVGLLPDGDDGVVQETEFPHYARRPETNRQVATPIDSFEDEQRGR